MNKTIIPVLYYHSISLRKNADWIRNYLTLELKYFEIHLREIIQKHFTTCFLKDYYLHKKGEIQLPSNSICLTFDDGYLDFWTHVFPMLKKYSAKATVFINPELTEYHIPRKTLEDYTCGRASLDEITTHGYLSWEEMAEMEQSGLVDVQSHTYTHTKHFISDRLKGFHNPGYDNTYLAFNLTSNVDVFRYSKEQVQKLMPFGYPVFEQAASVMARKVEINPEFVDEVIELLRDHDWSKKDSSITARRVIQPAYDQYRKDNSIITARESEEDYLKRVEKEISESRNLIADKLNKEVDFCCWPHGENNQTVHDLAMESGYLASTAGKLTVPYEDPQRIIRMGMRQYMNNRLITIIRSFIRIKSFQEKLPYPLLTKLYRSKSVS